MALLSSRANTPSLDLLLLSWIIELPGDAHFRRQFHSKCNRIASPISEIFLALQKLMVWMKNGVSLTSPIISAKLQMNFGTNIPILLLLLRFPHLTCRLINNFLHYTSVTQSSHVCRRFVAGLKLCDEFARAMMPP